VPHPGERLAKERHARGKRVVERDRALPRARPGARQIFFDCDEFQRGDLVDVDEPGGAREAHRHHRHEALASGEELRTVAVASEQRAGFDDRCGAGILERSGFHCLISKSR